MRSFKRQFRRLLAGIEDFAEKLKNALFDFMMHLLFLEKVLVDKTFVEQSFRYKIWITSEVSALYFDAALHECQEGVVDNACKYLQVSTFVHDSLLTYA